MPDFSVRSAGPEVMDDLQITGPDLHQALRELDAINYLLGGNYVTLNALAKLLDEQSPRQLEIVDIGCGSGDMLKRIRKLLERRQLDALLYGIDANPNVVRYAINHTPGACRIHYEAMNIFSEEFQRRKFDIVTATLFCHHFTDDQLVGLFRKLKDRGRVGMIINDIHRHWFAYHSIKWLTRIFSRSAMVKNDAPQSVLRAFHKSELEDILKRAGISEYHIRWCWAFRWQVIARF
jgi:2-polyprenyl-3-methyl-5-hydroxy-6-metoxy-1,4-benzoquinol methylase